MALYDMNGLIFKVWDAKTSNMKFYDVEYIRNKPYDICSYRIYWVDEDKLYFKYFAQKSEMLQNNNLIGVREISVLQGTLVVITHNYTIGVFNLVTNTYEEFGSPNPELIMTKIHNYDIIKPDQVFKFGDFDHDFSKYCGQNMLLNTLSWDVKKEKCNPYNKYMRAEYETENLIDRNDKFLLYRENTGLQIMSYDYGKKYDVPDNCTLYNPKFIETKSARSV